MGRKYNLTGKKFGRLTVISDSGERDYDGAILWSCICDCGVSKRLRTQSLTISNVKSCGCLRNEISKAVNTIHNYHGTRIYKIWDDMHQRCTNKNNTNFHHYGGRGITISEEWKNFEVFKDWAVINGYHENLSIDRINNNKGYSPDNCRWTTSLEQGRNKRSNRMITIEDETKCLSEWVEKFNLKYGTVFGRIRKGDPPELWFLSKIEYKKRSCNV
jgi:hypothetical protein